MTQSKFTKADIALFQQEARLKSELAALKEITDVKRHEIADSFGEGQHKIAGFLVEVRMQLRHSTEWKNVAFALAPESVVNKQKAEFTKNIEVVAVKIIE